MNSIIVNPNALTERDVYKILTGLVVPRAIAWVSTVNQAGQANLAPFSYFTIASSQPPLILFCPQLHPDGRAKDTLQNIEATGEWVVNIVSESLAAAMNRTAGLYPPEVDEFTIAEVTPLLGSEIAVPRVAEAPAALECRLEQLISLPTSAIVVGRVLAIHMNNEVYQHTYVNIEALQPIGRGAGATYIRCQDNFKLERPL